MLFSNVMPPAFAVWSSLECQFVTFLSATADYVQNIESLINGWSSEVTDGISAGNRCCTVCLVSYVADMQCAVNWNAELHW